MIPSIIKNLYLKTRITIQYGLTQNTEGSYIHQVDILPQLIWPSDRVGINCRTLLENLHFVIVRAINYQVYLPSDWHIFFSSFESTDYKSAKQINSIVNQVRHVRNVTCKVRIINILWDYLGITMDQPVSSEICRREMNRFHTDEEYCGRNAAPIVPQKFTLTWIYRHA